MALAEVQAGDTGAGGGVASGVAGTVLPGNSTSGHCVAVCIQPLVVGDSVASVTSSIGTFVKVGAQAGVAGIYSVEWWVCLKATGAATTVTPTMTNGGAYVAQASEWSGGVAQASLLTVAQSTGTSASVVATPGHSGDAVLVGLTCYYPFTSGPGSPWTQYTGGFWALADSEGMAWQVASSTSPVTATWSGASPSSNYAAVAIGLSNILSDTGNLVATATNAATAAITKVVAPAGNLAAKVTNAIPTTSGGFAPQDKVPWMLPVAINDHPYVMDFAKSRITTMQIRRQSSDESVEPGEQTLSAAGVWPRAQDNFFMGAGQEFLDNRFAFSAVYVHSGETPSVRTRYWKSLGVNPWGEGKLTLHNEYASIATSSANLLIIVCGNYLYKTDGIKLYYTLSPVGTANPSWTQVTMANTHNVVSLATDGSRVWAACGVDGVYVTVAGAGASAAAATPAALNNVQGLLGYVAGAGTVNSTNLPNGATTWYVTKVDAFGNETAATSVTVTVASTPINLNWQPDTNASNFNVYRGTGLLVYTGDVPSFVDDGSVVGASQTRPTSNGTGVSAYPATFISYQKGHLIGSKGRDLVEILANGSVSFIYQHENPSFVWTCATECPSAILVGGYAGSNSFIGAIQPDAATNGATLAPPIWASSLTPGEQINDIQYDSGSILLATNLGIRSGTKPDSVGVFDVNPVIQDPGSVLCVAPWGQYEYFGWSNYNPTENWAGRSAISGLGRADLSQYSAPGIPGYASDVMGVTSGSTTQVVVMQGVPYFVVNNSGAYTLYGPDGKLVSTGWMESGWVRYGSLENKILVEVDFQHKPLPSGASVSFDVVSEDEITVNHVGTNSVLNSTTLKNPFSAGLIVGDRFMPIITLNATPDQSAGPVFLSYITKAMTTTKRQDEVLLALVWDDKSRTLGPANKTWQMDLLAEYTYLKGLEGTGNTVNLTMLSLVKVVYIDQVLLEPFDEVNDQRTFFRGTVTVKMITLS